MEFKEPPILTELIEQSAKYGPVSLGHLFYELALALANNMNGTGRAYTAIKESGLPPHRSIIMPGHGFIDSPYAKFSKDTIDTILPRGDAEIITFRSIPHILDNIAELRRLIPPIISTPVVKDMIRRLNGDTKQLKFHRRKVQRFLARIAIDDESISSDFPVIMPSCDFELLYNDEYRNQKIVQEFIRRKIIDSRGLVNAGSDVSLFYGADEALFMITSLLSKLHEAPMQIAMQPNEYHRYMQLVDFLGGEINTLDLRFDDPSKTEIDEKNNVVYISNPNNPCGIMMSPEQLNDFIKSLKPDATLIIDTTGSDSNYSTSQFSSEMQKVVDAVTDKTIILIGSISKKEHAPWLRIGWAYSNNEMLNLNLRKIETKISPTVGIIFEKNREWMKLNDVDYTTREYMSEFHSELRGIVSRRGDDVRIYMPESAREGEMVPSGYFTTIQFANIRQSHEFNARLAMICETNFDTPLEPPIHGNEPDGFDLPTGVLNPSMFNRRGLPYLPTTATRLCTVGPAFQISALRQTFGMK